MLENRQALAKDSKFEIENKIGSRTILTIIDVIGYGASCIVYKANDAIALSDSVETATRIVKEYYPRNVAGLTRKGNDILVPGTAKDAFAEGQLQFERGITRYIEYYEQYDLSANPRPFVFGSANGTVYSVSDLSTGKTLSNIDTKGLTLY